jgi:hypothetical protein
LCDFYDCVDLVQPWFESWLAEEETQSKVVGQEEWLSIAWVFGREEIFESLAKYLVRNLGAFAGGFTRDGQPALSASNVLTLDILG